MNATKQPCRVCGCKSTSKRVRNALNVKNIATRILLHKNGKEYQKLATLNAYDENTRKIAQRMVSET